MNVVISIDTVDSCIHNNLCIYVNLCQILKSLDHLENFVCIYLTVHSMKPINIFKIDQILCDSEQNIDFKICKQLLFLWQVFLCAAGANKFNTCTLITL